MSFSTHETVTMLQQAYRMDLETVMNYLVN